MIEREARVQRLLQAGIIKSPDDIPLDAIPAPVEFIEHCRSPLRLPIRQPYFADQKYYYTDRRQWFTWKAGERRYWFEQLALFCAQRVVRDAVGSEEAHREINMTCPTWLLQDTARRISVPCWTHCF